MENWKLYNALSKKEVGNKIHMSSLKGYIHNISYYELVEIFGEPTFQPEDSGDGKVNYEWVVPFKVKGKDKEYFTIYDWKTYDPEYTKEMYTRWHVGGKTGAIDFIDAVEQTLVEVQ